MFKKQAFWILEINIVYIPNILKNPQDILGKQSRIKHTNISALKHTNTETSGNKFSSSYPQMNSGIRLRESIVLRALWICGLQILGGLFLVQSSSSKARKPEGVQQSSTAMRGGQGQRAKWTTPAP